LQPGDIARLVSVADPAVSPDGRSVTVTVTTVDVDANRYRSAIWLVPAGEADGAGRPLTAGAESDSSARWSPDGRRIAFVRAIRADDGTTTSRLLVLPVDDPGEPVCVATSRHGLSALDWSPDGERLAWCARVPDDNVDAGTKDHDRPPRRIDTMQTRLDDVGWIVDRRTQVFVGRVDGTEAPRQVTAGPFEHQSPRWSPDGRNLVLGAARHDGWDLDLAVDLYLVDADDAAADLRRLAHDGRTWSQPSWSPDGTRIAALVGDEREGWRNTRPVVLDVASGAMVDAAPGIDRTFAPYPGERPMVWVDEDSLLAVREDRGRVGVVRLAADGSSAPADVDVGDHCVTGYDTACGTIAVTFSSPGEVGELHVDGVRRTAAAAAFLRACPALPAERFTAPSPADDGDVDAWFVAPDPAAVTSDRWPLIVSVHGGPATQCGDRWFDEWQLWASAGFAVVACNPHGSSGRDEAWGRAIRSPLAKVDPGTGWGGIDADDILAVLDAALERWPVLDPARVGVHGGSYGGFMASWLCARTDRFAAGCSERAVNNLLSEEWSSDLAGTFWRELGVTHLDHAEEYLRMSPATYVADIRCPMLLLHSESDLRCNIEQADALFVPLRMLGRDVEYWRFPGEGHELSRSGAPKHRIRRAELIIEFFRRTVGQLFLGKSGAPFSTGRPPG
jgi:dipeptidyl aminopeptidase/acylaminoacyl peptidase